MVALPMIYPEVASAVWRAVQDRRPEGRAAGVREGHALLPHRPRRPGLRRGRSRPCCHHRGVIASPEVRLPAAPAQRAAPGRVHRVALEAEVVRFTAAVVGTSFDSLARERAVLEPIGARVVAVREADHERALAACADADALLVDYFLCDAASIARLTRCRVICQYGVGLDQIDVAAATGAGIVVTHTPGYCVDELADHTWALILSVARQVGLTTARARGWLGLQGRPSPCGGCAADARAAGTGAVSVGRSHSAGAVRPARPGLRPAGAGRGIRRLRRRGGVVRRPARAQRRAEPARAAAPRDAAASSSRGIGTYASGRDLVNTARGASSTGGARGGAGRGTCAAPPSTCSRSSRRSADDPLLDAPTSPDPHAGFLSSRSRSRRCRSRPPTKSGLPCRRRSASLHAPRERPPQPASSIESTVTPNSWRNGTVTGAVLSSVVREHRPERSAGSIATDRRTARPGEPDAHGRSETGCSRLTRATRYSSGVRRRKIGSMPAPAEPSTRWQPEQAVRGDEARAPVLHRRMVLGVAQDLGQRQRVAEVDSPAARP